MTSHYTRRKKQRKERKHFGIPLLVKSCSSDCSKIDSQVIISNWRQLHPGCSKGLHLARVLTLLAELHWFLAIVNLVQTQHSAKVSTIFLCSDDTTVHLVGCVCTGSPTLSVSRNSTCGMSSMVLVPTGRTSFFLSAPSKQFLDDNKKVSALVFIEWLGL